MKKHIELLGLLYIIFSAFNILSALIVFFVFASIGFFSGMVDFPSDQYYDPDTVFNILLVVAILLVIFLFILAIPGFIGGYGLLKRRSWSRILVIILGSLNLLSIPFGTTLGIYTLWVLLQDDAIAYLSAQEQNSTSQSST